jgi:hypothetical protein
MKRIFLILLLVLLSSLVAAQAQVGLDGTAPPRFGEVNLGEISSYPDPFIITIVAGGPLDAAQQNLPEGCVGFVASNPDFRINLADEMELFRIFFASTGDTTLIVQQPDTSFLCADDSGIGGQPLNPMLDIENAAVGTYSIWIGTFRESDLLGGYLVATFSPDTLPSQIVSPLLGNVVASAEEIEGRGDTDCVGGMNFTCAPNYGEVELASGFTDDPFTVQTRSGGPVSVVDQGLPQGCRGYVTSAPDFRLRLTSQSPRLRIFYVADEAGADTTLVINTTTGAWACNDDSPTGTLNPMVELTDAEAGQYDIWIGSYDEGEFHSGTLYITEQELDPSNP